MSYHDTKYQIIDISIVVNGNVHHECEITPTEATCEYTYIKTGCH